MNDDLYKLVFFLVSMEKDQPFTMYATHTIEEVVESLANIMKVPVEKLRELA